MKPFNLEEALAGAPVKLVSGEKAYIIHKIENQDIILGYTVNTQGRFLGSMYWHYNGKAEQWLSSYSIVEMWEEPTPTITVTLPRPFKPKKNDHYYFIGNDEDTNLEILDAECDGGTFDFDLINQGNCFRTREDAKAWLDAMKGALNE